MPNKCAFKKLIQFISASCNSTYEMDTVSHKIEEIKSKIKSITKNNDYLNFELDYLFDQRWANLEPTYEKISLVHCTPKPDSSCAADVPQSIVRDDKFTHEEYIDLTREIGCSLKLKKTPSGKVKKPINRNRKSKFLITLKPNTTS